MTDDLTAKCAGCGRKCWLGDMSWRGDKRYCDRCAKEYQYKGGDVS